MHFAHFMNTAGIEEDPFRYGGFARVDMGDNAQIPGFAQFLCLWCRHGYDNPS